MSDIDPGDFNFGTATIIRPLPGGSRKVLPKNLNVKQLKSSFEKALKAEAVIFKDQQMDRWASGIKTSRVSLLKKSFIVGGKWALDWVLNNSSFINRSYQLAIRQAEKLRTENQRLREALEKSIEPLELYRAYGWPDRGRVIYKAKQALAETEGE